MQVQDLSYILDVPQWQIEARAECVEIGEHFRQILSDNGQDVCFNCGCTN